MQIRADRIGMEVLLKRSLRRFPAETAAAMADIENDTACARFDRLGKQAAVRNQTVAAALEAMREDVAGAQFLQGFRGARTLADVHHQRQPGASGRFKRAFERLAPILTRGLFAEPKLHAQ